MRRFRAGRVLAVLALLPVTAGAQISGSIPVVPVALTNVKAIPAPDDAETGGRALFLSGGRLLVAFHARPPLTLYDSAASTMRPLARTGEGPGEFAWLSQMAPHGDSLIIYDNRNHRVTVLDQHLSTARSRPFTDVSAHLVPFAMTRDGHLLFRSEDPGFSAIVRDTLRVLIGEGIKQRTLLMAPQYPPLISVEAVDGGLYALQQLDTNGPRITYSAAEDALVTLTVEPVTGTSATIVARWYRMAGPVMRERKLQVPVTTRSTAERTAVIDEHVKSIERLASRRKSEFQDLRAKVERVSWNPGYVAPLGDWMQVDWSGAIWFTLASQGARPARICRIQPAAHAAECAVLPKGATPLAADIAGRVVIATRDADDLPLLVEYRLGN